MNRRRKVLFVSLDVPARTGSGSIVRTFHFLRGLSAKYEVDLLILQPVHDAERHSLEQLCQRVISLQPNAAAKGSIWPKIAKCLLFPFSDAMLPLYDCLHRVRRSLEHGRNRALTRVMLHVAQRCLGVFSAAGERLRVNPPSSCSLYFNALENCTPSLIEAGGQSGGRYDVLWFEHTVSFPLIRILQKSVRAKYLICNSHNVEYLLARQLTKNTASGDTDAATIMKTEAKCLQSVNLTLTCSQADKDEFQKLCPAANLVVAPNGVELSYFNTGGSRRHDGFTLLFTGAMSYQPNLEGVRYFIDEIFPLIKAQEPRTKLIVAGRAADLLQGVDTADIEVVANPEDMRTQFCRATLAIVPLKSGGGTRLKILEAMAMGLPVVSTTIGAEGVGYRNGYDLELADTPEQFSKAVIDLLRNPAEQQRFSNAGRSFVEKCFDWEVITSNALEQIEEHCPGGSVH